MTRSLRSSIESKILSCSATKFLALALLVFCTAFSTSMFAEEEQTLTIKEFRVSGNTTIDPLQIELVLYPFTGPDKKVSYIEDARLALEKFFQDQGYPTVSVSLPPQNVANGIVYMEVEEGRTNIVTISGSDYFTLSDIRRQLPSLARGEVLYLPRAREELAALNQNTKDFSVTPVLKPGFKAGTLDVELKVKDELPIHGRVEFNNRYTANSRPNRLSASLSYDNLWQKYHSASIQYQVSPQDLDQVKVLVGTYVFPLFDDHKFAFYAVESESNVPAAGVLSVLGEGKILGGRWIVPLTPDTRYFHNFTYGFDYKDFKDRIDLFSGESLTEVNYSQLFIQYSGNYFGLEQRSGFKASFTFAPGSFDNDQEEFRDKRFDSENSAAEPSYSYWRLSADYTRFFEHLSFDVDFSSQYSDRLLISNEQFTIGGLDTVRGYLESQTSSDVGAILQLELQTTKYDFEDLYVSDAYAYAFLDGGKGRLNDSPLGVDRSVVLSSGGLGFSLQSRYGLFAEAAWAYPFKTQGDIENGEDRFHFNLGLVF